MMSKLEVLNLLKMLFSISCSRDTEGNRTLNYDEFMFHASKMIADEMDKAEANTTAIPPTQERTMDRRLSPCPFCGGPAEMHQVSARDYGCYNVHVECRQCGATGGKVYQSEKMTATRAESLSIESWNKRPA